jgi:hypothetical protein
VGVGARYGFDMSECEGPTVENDTVIHARNVGVANGFHKRIHQPSAIRGGNTNGGAPQDVPPF